jgi:hypothetical protein
MEEAVVTFSSAKKSSTLNRGHSSEFCRGTTQFAAHNARGGFIARLSSVGEIV